ncbi:MAG: hypothetical protein CMG75_05110 [Candidatus Marinimicrobia bacterium]|nr:hypothetical protein [Candidatus Neomarinimicrobiota bacterium]
MKKEPLQNHVNNAMTNKKKNISQLAKKPIRIKFFAKNLKLYSFWISQNNNGASRGSIASGGPGLSGYWDT